MVIAVLTDISRQPSVGKLGNPVGGRIGPSEEHSCRITLDGVVSTDSENLAASLLPTNLPLFSPPAASDPARHGSPVDAGMHVIGCDVADGLFKPTL
jgi:hypothetical protein